MKKMTVDEVMQFLQMFGVYVPGNFDVPPKILKAALHEWSEKKTTTILEEWREGL